LEYVLHLAEDVSCGNKSPNSAIAAVVAVITQDKIVALGHLAIQAFRGVGTTFIKRKRFHRRYSSGRLCFDEDRVFPVAESLQILKGANRAILVNVITDSPARYLLIVDLEALVVVRNSVTRKTDYPLRIAQGFILGILEDDDVSSSHLR